ncbi:MAG: CDP-diacylglycerol--glycerol-3-phosphate 3-phosphatidyltransferase [Lactobacillales bacterium]|nr:CDP-diacylglycerol--glycerol-3-phosphate 3-phosphatidyltransferase [Lactobacillales bacterium]
MNLPNKITMSRIVLTIFIIVLLLFPFDAAGINMPKLFVNESLVVDITYVIAGVLFIIASLTDFVDGYIARKYNLVTDFGKMIDAIADKILVNPILIILAAKGFVSPLIPVIIVCRDSIVNSIKMIAGSKGNVVAAIKLGKLKTACLMTGIVLTLFYNLPFELLNLKVSDALLIVACVLSIISGIEYYNMNKKFIFDEKTEKIEVE